jgi:hypothetical protein
MKGKKPRWVLEKTWEGIGDKDAGKKILYGKSCEFFTMKDAGLV